MRIGLDTMWLSDDELEIDGQRFHFVMGGASTDEEFVVTKEPELARDYVSLLERHRDGNVVELGIFQGGSAALAFLVAQPRKLVVLDICEPVAALDAFVARRQIGEVLKPYYGVDQADTESLRAIVAEEFAGQPLDLVIDDASHLGHETRVSFDVLFPLLRPGGLYVIEDWRWELAAGNWLRGAVLAGDLDLLRTALVPRLQPEDPWWPTASRWLGEALAEGSTDLARATRSALADLGVDVAAFHEPAAETRTRGTGGARTEGTSFLATFPFELTVAVAQQDGVVDELVVGERWTIVRRGPAELDPSTFHLSESVDDCFGLLPR